MNRIIIIFAIIFIIITGVIGVVKPQIYKPVRFAAANMGIENVNEEIVETKSPIIEDTGMPVVQVELKPEIQKTTVVEQKIKVQPQKTQVNEKPIKTDNQKSQTIQKNIKNQTKKSEQVKEVKSPVSLPKSVQEIVKTETSKTQQNNTTIVQKQEPAVTLPPKNEPKTVLTEEEEVILWNKWRSDLQNQVMRDARVAAEMGTRFRFSFTVDKFGNISNLRVWSDTPYYTPLAVQSIKPVLMSYQGKNILKFPKGTKRVVTNVTGGFVISTYDKYSRPDDYADVEKIRRLKNVQM